MTHLFLVMWYMVKICGFLFAFRYSIALAPFIEFSFYYSKSPEQKSSKCGFDRKRSRRNDNNIQKNFLKTALGEGPQT